MKPKVFIGSSVKGLKVAEAIQKALAHDADAILWSQGIFRSTHVPIESLMTAVATFDFAIFVLLPEDPLSVKGSDALSVRDNVLFELGLFLGKLGRERTFFVAPHELSPKDLYLPSDLSGITPASYDPNATNLEATVATALFEFKGLIRKAGPPSKDAPILYDSSKDFKPFHFVHKNERIYEKDKPVGEKSDAELKFLENGVFQLDRANLDGRYVIELRRKGRKAPSISKHYIHVERVLRVSCEAKVEGGAHSLRFVLKNIETDKWEADQTKSIKNSEWERIDLYFSVPPTADLLFRIDDLRPSKVPSRLYLRGLQIAEES
ncbi:MAG: hypothetical protein QOJ86_1528 [Bradyrhizobium sp.]|jgi:hypothetical protein|nr:hypothetical protein [Bradyrhizobium sp.]